MTFREKIQTEHPEMVDKRFGGGVKGCPYHYGYEKNLNCMVWESNAECEECWNREMPNTETKSYNQNLRERIIEEIYHAIDSDRQMCIGADIQNYLLKVLEDNMDYNKGLNDAWELARKIFTTDCTTLQKVFGHSDEGQIIMTITPQEALAKMKAYEEAQSKIEVGDVVTYAGEKCVVLDKRGSKIVVLMEEGVYEWYECDVEKTGKHIDIKKILEAIGE